MSDFDDKKGGGPPDDDKSLLSSKKGDEILHVIKKGTEFTHEIIKENEKLRYRLAQVEEENVSLKRVTGGAGTEEMEVLQKKLNMLSEEKTHLQERFKEVESENQDFAERYLEIENENNVLANLYVASYQLHSTLDFNEVLRIIMEIIINLIGAEQFAILILDEKSHELVPVSAEGIDMEKVPKVKLDEGPIGTSGKSGDEYFKEDLSEATKDNFLDPLVSIPMKIKDRVIGVIVINSMLQQKDEFTKLDYELFTLLAGHTATAIFSAKLYSESERKLSTIQGFIDLLTK